jgi:hypothetical protein
MSQATVDQWMTPAAAARRLDLSPDWIRDLCSSGRLVHQRTPLGRLVSRADVERFAAARRTRGNSDPLPAA